MGIDETREIEEERRADSTVPKLVKESINIINLLKSLS